MLPTGAQFCDDTPLIWLGDFDPNLAENNQLNVWQSTTPNATYCSNSKCDTFFDNKAAVNDLRPARIARHRLVPNARRLHILTNPAIRLPLDKRCYSWEEKRNGRLVRSADSLLRDRMGVTGVGVRCSITKSIVGSGGSVSKGSRVRQILWITTRIRRIMFMTSNCSRQDNIFLRRDSGYEILGFIFIRYQSELHDDEPAVSVFGS